MKCSRCGFYNLPGVAECAGCGALLRPRLAPDEFYPRRAREVTRYQRWRERLDLRCRALRQRASAGWSRAAAAWEGVRARAREARPASILSGRALWRALPSVIPGLGQMRRGDTSRGCAMLFGAVGLVLLGAVCFYNPLSNFCLTMLLLLSLWSVSDAWLALERKRQPAQPIWQPVVIPLYVLSLYFSVYVGAASIAQRWYPVYRVRRSVGASLLRGDRYLVRRLPVARHPESALSLRPGALIVYRAGAQPVFGRVVGFAAAPSSAAWPARTAGVAANADASSRSSEPRILIRPVGYYPLAPAVQFPPVARPLTDVIGPVILRFDPPRRRAWVGER